MQGDEKTFWRNENEEVQQQTELAVKISFHPSSDNNQSKSKGGPGKEINVFHH